MQFSYYLSKLYLILTKKFNTWKTTTQQYIDRQLKMFTLFLKEVLPNHGQFRDIWLILRVIKQQIFCSFPRLPSSTISPKQFNLTLRIRKM